MELVRSATPVTDQGPDSFATLLVEVEPQLRRALVAAYGPEEGREACADALAWAWEHPDRMVTVSNPAGYLWRVAQTSMRRHRRRARFEVPQSGRLPDEGSTSAATPSGGWDRELVEALRMLTVHQRVAVVLVDAYGYQLAEAAGVLACSVSTIRNHLARGRSSLRARLEGTR